MTGTPTLRGAVHQNLYLAEGGREVHAVVTVDAEAEHDRAPQGSGPAAAEVLILDCSGSMGHSPEKITRAKEAAAAAIDELRDGVPFAVVAGTSVARMHWPAEPALVPADARARAAAIASLERLSTGGGTAIGAWLRLAGRLLGGYPATTIRHAVLLTDGRNEHESPADLAAAVRDCAGLFTCDCRGVGTDWSVSELRTIASALLGTVGMVAEPTDLAAEFRTTMSTAMGKGVSEVGLRLWTPAGATVRFVKQAAPSLSDLTAQRVGSGPQTGDYPTGSWGTESRDYHLCIEVEPGDLGDEKLAGRVTFVHPGADGTTHPLPQTFDHAEPDGTVNAFPHARVRAWWTDDLAQVSALNEKVAVVTGKAELAQAMHDGLQAYQCGDPAHALDRLGRARELAEQCQDANLLARLDQLCDPGTGTITLHRLSAREEIELDIESTKTTPLRRG